MARRLGFVALVDFGGKDEIALRQAVDLVRPGRDLDFSPGKRDVWVMPLLLRQLTNVIYELEGFAKVRKLEGLRDVVFFADVPTVHLCFEGGELLTLERGHTSTARNACFGRKIGHRRSYSTTHLKECRVRGSLSSE